MTDFDALLFTAATIALVVGVLWAHAGGFYYARYPVADLLDDAMRLGLLSEHSMDSLLTRLCSAADVRAECVKVRAELGIRRTSTWEKLLFQRNRRRLG